MVNGIYGYQDQSIINPFNGAPMQAANGGLIYFDSGINKDDFYAFMRIIGVHEHHTVSSSKEFGAFMTESQEPSKDGYLRQLRLVSKDGLSYMFRTFINNTEYNTYQDQKMTMREALWAFIDYERKSWECTGLQGLFGGDGDFAIEALSFGLMIENDYHHIYRIWSRAWLVTR